MTSREPGTVEVPALRHYRRQAALTQTALADKAGVGRSTVINAENGQRVRLSSVFEFARVLKVAPRLLMQPAPTE